MSEKKETNKGEGKKSGKNERKKPIVKNDWKERRK